MQADAELNSDAGSSQATAAAQPTERSFKVQILNSIEAVSRNAGRFFLPTMSMTLARKQAERVPQAQCLNLVGPEP